MKKKIAIIVPIILVLSLVPIIVTSAIAGKEEISREEYNKIHVYAKSPAYSYIDDRDELYAALEYFHSRSEASFQNSDALQITVSFKGDLSSTEEYKALVNSRGNARDSQDVTKFREKLNALSKEYHRGLIENHIGLLSSIPYSSMEKSDYSPSVCLTVKAKELTAEMLEHLVTLKSITHISIGYPHTSSDE